MNAPRSLTSFSTWLFLVAGTSAVLMPAAYAEGWSEDPLETLGDTHRVREGYVAPAVSLAADAATAAQGIVVGQTAADQALTLRARAAVSGLASNSDSGGPYFTTGDSNDTWVADLNVGLADDSDQDGFFAAVDFSIDVDTTGIEQEVYAIIELNEPDGSLTLSHTTRNFIVRGNATSDEYRVEIALLDNHRAGFRDVRIEIRDGWNNEQLDVISASSYASLRSLPLESEQAFHPIDDDYPAKDFPSDDYNKHHKDGKFALGVLLTGSTQSSKHHHHDDYDTYVTGYAGAAGPLGTFFMAVLILVRRTRHQAQIARCADRCLTPIRCAL